MSYEISFNSRMNQTITEQLFDESSKSVKLENLISMVTKRSLTQLDKFVIYIKPTDEKAQFTLDERIVSDYTGRLKGKARSLMMRKLDVIEKEFNRCLVVESERSFSRSESVLDFIEKNDDLLDLLAQNPVCHDLFFDKMTGLVIDLDSKDADQVSWVMRTLGCKTQAERAKSLFQNTAHKLAGPLSKKEAKRLMQRSDYRYYQVIRLSKNIRNYINRLSASSDNKEVILKELSDFLNSLWKDVCKGSDFKVIDKKLGSYELRDNKFWIIYDAIFNCKKDIVEGKVEIQKALVRTMLENGNVDDILKFLKVLHACSENQKSMFPYIDGEEADKRREVNEREILCLKSIPLKRFLGSLMSDPARAPHLTSSDDIFRMGLLLFIESIKNDDVEGLDIAQRVIESRENNEKVLMKTMGLLDQACEQLGYGATSYQGFIEDRIPNLVLSTLNSEELEIFKESFYSIFDSPAES